VITLRKRVLKRWRELSEAFEEPNIEILFKSKLSPDEATGVLEQALEKAFTEFEATHSERLPDTGEPAFFGEWHVIPVTEGSVLVGGRKCDAGTDVLRSLTAALNATKLTGTLDLYARPAIAPPQPGFMEITAHVQPNGHIGGGPRRDWWISDPTDLSRVIELAEQWCLQARPDLAITVQHGAAPAIPIPRSDSPLQRVNEGPRTHWTTLCSSAMDRWRKIVIDHHAGGTVDLIEGGTYLDRNGIEPAVNSLKAVLNDAASHVVYGHITPISAFLPSKRYKEPSTATAQADHILPDAHPIMLLGPQYPQPLPALPNWTTTPYPAQRTLLEHAHLEAWFRKRTLVDAVRGRIAPITELREQSRETLAELIHPNPRN
jgi:hypothetical protein